MGVRYYDEALVSKLRGWIKENKVHVIGPDEVSRFLSDTADEKNDRITLPLISLSRDRRISLRQQTKTVMTFDGMMLESDGEHTLQLNAIPITIDYQLDIWASRYDEADELLRNFLFNLMNFPGFEVKIPYNGKNLTHVAHLTLNDSVEDTSNIQQRLFEGQFTRWTIRFTVNDAYIFSLPYVNNVSMDCSEEGTELWVSQNMRTPHEFVKEPSN